MKKKGISPYEALGNAVVLQAAKDYRAAYKRWKRHPEDAEVKSSLSQIERFFQSQRFHLFTELDGKALLHRLRKELEEE